MSLLAESVAERVLLLPEIVFPCSFHSLDVHDSNCICGPGPDDMTLGIEAAVVLSVNGRHRHVVLGWWRKPKMDTSERFRDAVQRIAEQVKASLAEFVREEEL